MVSKTERAREKRAMPFAARSRHQHSVSYGGRPPHIHVRVRAPRFEELVTQHYPERGQRKANFDLVLVAE
jgi:protocatechuate 3,4-dioxygenase beta subunit